MRLNQGALPSPMPGHFSLNPGGTHSSNTPQMSIDPLLAGRYSTHGVHHDRSAAETESYRSRSPPVDESRELVIPPINFSGPSMNIGSARDSIVRRPGLNNSSYPSPIGDNFDESLDTERLAALRPNRANNSRSLPGPHELAVGSESGYAENRSQDYRHESGQNGIGNGFR